MNILAANNSTRKFGANLWFAVAFFVGLAISILLYLVIVTQEQKRIDALAHQQALTIAGDIEAGIKRRSLQIATIANFITSSEWVSFKEYKQFINLVYNNDLPKDRAVTWLIWSDMESVPLVERYLQRNKEERYKQYKIFNYDYEANIAKPLNKSQESVLAIAYSVPEVAVPDFTGRNIGVQRPVYHNAMRVLNSGSDHISGISGPIPAVDSIHFFITSPVFKYNDDGTKNISGFMVSGNNLERLFSDIVGNFLVDTFEFVLEDQLGTQYLYPENTVRESDKPQTGAVLINNFSLSGSGWKLRIYATELHSAYNNPLLLVLGMAVFIICLLIAFFIRQSLLRSEQLEKMVDLQTKSLVKKNEHLKFAVENATLAEKAKSEFLATMSHEIRTPMNAVLGMAKLMERTQLDNKQRMLMSKVHASADHLMKIINEILDYSKIEAGGLAIEQMDFTLASVYERLIATHDDACNEKGVEFLLNSDFMENTVFRGDFTRICQVLLNLCSNAVKFTRTGKIIVNASFCGVDDNAQGVENVKLIVEVIDTGVGIDGKYLPHLFDAFTQADNSSTRQYGGTGLGLSIAAKLCRMMGGDINVRSEVGKGSTFRASFVVHLPKQSLAKNEVDNSVIIADDIPHTSVSQVEIVQQAEQRILVVEDNESNRQLLQLMLADSGFEPMCVNDGSQALAVLRSESDRPPFVLIVMDCQMPVMDGFETCSRIRAGEAGEFYKSIPILACTANAMVGDAEKCIQVGMNDYITKPIDHDVFEEKISALCKLDAAN